MSYSFFFDMYYLININQIFLNEVIIDLSNVIKYSITKQVIFKKFSRIMLKQVQLNLFKKASLILDLFFVQKVSWWSENSTLIILFRVTLFDKLAKIWFIVLELVRIAFGTNFINSWKLQKLQHLLYFLTSLGTDV